MWKQWDQQEIDRQMSPSQWSHRMDADSVIQAHIQTLKCATEAARIDTSCTYSRTHYGPGCFELIDAYLPKTVKPHSAVLYIHGGMWQALSIDESGFAAGPLTSRGIALFALEYTIAPKGNIRQMVHQTATAVAYVLRSTSCPLVIAGHSAGGHLAAQMQWIDWSKYDLSSCDLNRVCGIFAVSPLLHLKPVQLSYANENLMLTDEDVTSFSPLILIGKRQSNFLTCQVVLVIAQHEPTEFRNHSEEYATQLSSHGTPVKLIDCNDVDHFDCIERLSSPEHCITTALIQLASCVESNLTTDK
eukprot:gene434-3772_t